MIVESKYKTFFKDVAIATLFSIIAFILSLNIPSCCLHDIESVFSYGLGIRRAVFLLGCVYLLLLLISMKNRRVSVATRCMMIVSPAFLMLFFAMAPIITFDSGHYLNYLPILNGQVGFEEWDIVRGPVFPVMLNAIIKFFGHSPQGVLSAQYLFFMASLYCVLLILESQVRTQKNVSFVLLIVVVLFFCNPIFQGGFHTLLTEFPAAFVTTLTCWIAWRWMKRTGRLSKSDAGYALYFIVMSVVMWQLKQPYMGCVLYPLVVVVFCSFINKEMRSGFRALFRLAVIFTSIVCMLISTSAWNSFIDSFGKMDETRTTQALAERTLVEALPIRYVGQYKSQEILSQFDANCIAKKDALYNVYQLDTLKEGLASEYLFIEDTGRSGISSKVALLLKCWSRFPKESLEKYIISALKISNILAANPDRPNMATLMIETGSGDENNAIYYRLINGYDNVFWVSTELEEAVEPFRADYSCAMGWKNIQIIFVKMADVLFKVLNVGTVFVWCMLFVAVLLKRKNLYENNSLILHFMLWSYCFANLLLNTFLRATIDRYVFSNYFVAWISMMIVLVSFAQRMKFVFNEKRKYLSN